MADKIDELELDISVTENQAAKKINQISKAITTLTETLTNLKSVSGELDKLSKISLPKGLKNIKNLKINYKLQTATMPTAEKPQGTDFNGVQTGEAAKVQLKTLGILKTKTEGVVKTQKRLENHINNTSKAYKRTSLNISKVFNQEKNLEKQQKKNNKETKQSASLWSKLTRSIVRVGFYRAVRTAINQISKAFIEGVKTYTQYDSATNKAMSNITNSFDQVKNTLGATAGMLLVQLEPVITRISDALVEFIDNINIVIAKMSGSNTYKKAIKQNKDYADSLKETTGALLKFDTFTTLNTGKQADAENPYEDVEIGELSKSQSVLQNIISSVLELKDVFNSIKNIVKNIFKYFQTENVQKIFKSMADQLRGIFKIIEGLTLILVGDFDAAWAKIKDGFKQLFKGIVDYVKNLVKSVIDILNPANWFKSGKNSFNVTGSLKRKSFAQGGSFRTADMFYANEDGRTELIASSNSGGGAVMNLDQWATISETSFYNALSRYGVAQNQRQSGFDMNSFGKMMASNTGFISEMNRRNALNLR